MQAHQEGGYVSPEPHCSLGTPAVMAWEQALTFNCHDLVKHVKEREEGRGGIWGYGEGEKERESQPNQNWRMRTMVAMFLIAPGHPQ